VRGAREVLVLSSLGIVADRLWSTVKNSAHARCSVAYCKGGSGLGDAPKAFVAATRGMGTSWREILWQSWCLVDMC